MSTMSLHKVYQAITLKPFWQYIKAKEQDNNIIRVAPIKAIGNLYTDPEDKAEQMNKQFQRVFTKPGSTSNSVPNGESIPQI